jgi:hypothetical protein
MKIDAYVKDIAAAATPEDCVADAATGYPQYKFARQVHIHCPAANTSDLIVGSKGRPGVGMTVVKGTTLVLPVPNGAGQASRYDLREILVKAGTNGDDVQIMIVDPTDT